MNLHPIDATPEKTFRYDGLNKATSDLRLIEIIPARDAAAPIFCRMHTYRVDLCPTSSNGGYLSVTSNLFSALVNLRKCRAGQPVDQRMLIWIDALCIDQQNLAERNDQVQRMKAVYQKAKKVIVYLGAYAESMDDQLQFSAEIWGIDYVEVGSYALTLAAFTIASCLSSVRNVADDEETIQMLATVDRDGSGSPLANRRGWAHLSRIFNRPWFERLWIIQELGVSQEAMALCGAIAVPWSTIEDTAAFILRPHTATPQTILRFFPLMGAHRVTQVALNNVRGIDTTNLLTILRHTQRASCSDPRDKLFAVLGVSDDKDDIAINYSKSFEDIYRHWAILRILRTKSLDVLNACADSSQTGELPSWVPDLRRPWAHDGALWRLIHRLNQQQEPYLLRDFMHIPSEFDNWRLEELFQDDHLKLSIDGFHIGMILSLSEVGDAVTNLSDPTFLTSRLLSIVNSWEDWYAEYQVTEPDRSSVASSDTSLDYVFRSALLHQSPYSPDYRNLSLQYLRWRRATSPSPPSQGFGDAQLRSLEASLFSLVHGCQMFAMNNDVLGMVAGNCHCQVGDEIYHLRGGLTPFVLRRTRSAHRLITPCFVNGSMDGHNMRFFGIPSWQDDLTKIVLE